MRFKDDIHKILASRDPQSLLALPHKTEAEGGCGVIGLACAEKVAGRHLLPALSQMCNRGNGKGGGIAAVGLSPGMLGVTRDVLENDYLFAVGYLDIDCRAQVENECIHTIFEVDHLQQIQHVEDYAALGIEIPPPEAVVYFVRVKKQAVDDFREKHQLKLPQLALEEEIVFRAACRLNKSFYASAGEKRAFVLSNGKNLLVLKMVGYGSDVLRYYKLEDFQAHVWIGHHRYPTKGRVWHPGGAHPFAGVNEALVHNGDFANYFSICEYLAQRNIYPLFLTDTEVSVLAFDLLYRTYNYPLEYVIESLAPTTERDFTLLPEARQRIYQMLQKIHLHGSPDGPWFFLIVQSFLSQQKGPAYRLIGITDTSMLRPQVFALQKGAAAIGFAASEKQAIDATLNSLASEDPRFWSHADYYWNARGGSHTDGGAFVFTVQPQPNGQAALECADKFGNAIHNRPSPVPFSICTAMEYPQQKYPDLPAPDLFAWAKNNIFTWNYEQICGFLSALVKDNATDESRSRAFSVITMLLDQRYPTGGMRRSCLLSLYTKSLSELVHSISADPSRGYAFLNYGGRASSPASANQKLLIDAQGYPSEGERSLALEIVRMYKMGYKKFALFNCQGQRFIGNGLGPVSHGVVIDVYGSSGDYLASGIDGAEIIVHGSAQDQLSQIMKDGTLVVHGDAGQTFMYGAKGGQAYIRGNAAGRPLINAVGKPRVVINGTCLDYLAESFMAGNPLKGGGFVILNGLATDEEGKIIELDTPYPGGNLFSLASGGAIYLRDPMQMVSEQQLNGGAFTGCTPADWDLILPYLETNAKLFDIPVSRLLEHEGRTLSFKEIYRKISPSHVHVLQEEEAWVKGRT